MNWSQKYSLRLAITDVFVIGLCLTAIQFIRFDGPSNLIVGPEFWGLNLNYGFFTFLLGFYWFISLWVFQTRNPKLLGVGASEYSAILKASFFVFGSITVLAFVSKTDFSRFYILVGLPLGAIMLIIGRFVWRYWLRSKRQAGLYSSKVIIVGSLESASAIGGQLLRFPTAGYQLVGACIPNELENIRIEISGNKTIEIPNFSSVENLILNMKLIGADSVLVTSSDSISTVQLKQLSWDLDPKNESLILASKLLDISGPRIHSRPVVGLPLMLVEIPSYSGMKKAFKRIFDLLMGVVLLLLLSPVFLIVSFIAALAKDGPIFFRQERIGLDGKPFQMLKFRSMITNAEQKLNELKTQTGFEEHNVLFKIENDPRITPLGRFMRKYSIDELPQLINVINGTMSLVGPRPPLPSEVELYESHVHRRFLVKPGITGLWQVSGRSKLSWDESVRLDLYYVENWSLIGDLVILWKTLRAVFTHEGAY